MRIAATLAKPLFGALLAALSLSVCASASAQTLSPKEGDFAVKDFRFADGSTLPAINMHYTTLGTLQRDAQGHATNAVLVLHGTNRRGGMFLAPDFSGRLFGPGQMLDASRYFIILPDAFGAGAGKSTKPSDGLRAKFPHYDYGDMIQLTEMLLKQDLQVDRVRLLVGTSMGCMQGFQWGESNPSYFDAMILLSCQPVAIGGRNRMVRKIMMDLIRNDPTWNNGNYTQQPASLRAVLGHSLVVTGEPKRWSKQYANAAEADKFVDNFIEQNLKTTDANDMMYQYDASRNYNPAPDLGKITAHVTLVNVYDDYWNPGEIDSPAIEMKKVKNGKFVLLPISDDTRGHYTFFIAKVWESYLAELLSASAK